MQAQQQQQQQQSPHLGTNPARARLRSPARHLGCPTCIAAALAIVACSAVTGGPQTTAESDDSDATGDDGALVSQDERPGTHDFVDPGRWPALWACPDLSMPSEVTEFRDRARLNVVSLRRELLRIAEGLLDPKQLVACPPDRGVDTCVTAHYRTDKGLEIDYERRERGSSSDDVKSSRSYVQVHATLESGPWTEFQIEETSSTLNLDGEDVIRTKWTASWKGAFLDGYPERAQFSGDDDWHWDGFDDERKSTWRGIDLKWEYNSLEAKPEYVHEISCNGPSLLVERRTKDGPILAHLDGECIAEVDQESWSKIGPCPDERRSSRCGWRF